MLEIQIYGIYQNIPGYIKISHSLLLLLFEGWGMGKNIYVFFSQIRNKSIINKDSQIFKDIPKHFQDQDSYHTLGSFLQHLGAIQVKECILLGQHSLLMPT